VIARALLEALLDEQEQILRGPPPLGPGAPAHGRLLAFVDALLAPWAQHGKLLLASETSSPSSSPGSRYRTGAYAAWHQHAALLLAECRPDVDAAVSAHLLLATVDAQLLSHVREEAGQERLARAAGPHDEAHRLGPAQAGPQSREPRGVSVALLARAESGSSPPSAAAVSRGSSTELAAPCGLSMMQCHVPSD
jgi:hypothetical protein